MENFRFFSIQFLLLNLEPAKKHFRLSDWEFWSRSETTKKNKSKSSVFRLTAKCKRTRMKNKSKIFRLLLFHSDRTDPRFNAGAPASQERWTVCLRDCPPCARMSCRGTVRIWSDKARLVCRTLRMPTRTSICFLVALISTSLPACVIACDGSECLCQSPDLPRWLCPCHATVRKDTCKGTNTGVCSSVCVCVCVCVCV